MTFKFNGWSRKTISHWFYPMSSFVHSLKSISKFKLESQSRNTQFRSKWCFFGLYELEIRALLLCYFKLCVSFYSHRWIQTGVTVQTCLIWVKIGDFFCPVWSSNLTDDLIGYLSYAMSSFVNHFIDISEIKLELQSANAQTGAKSVLTFVA